MQAIRILILIIILISCQTNESTKPVIYEGPLREAENVVMHRAEHDKIKMILRAKKVQEFQNGDREFPEGIYIEFFDPTGAKTSTLRANTAHYYKQENRWRGQGKVEVFNIEKGQQLHTEELFWNPAQRKILTDKFVTIKDQTDVIYGTGLIANQDLSNYLIKDVKGTVGVNE
jgi:LPS export ABC transporter protein LptC